ncbi:MAG: prolipoprotein diacylglyceryl transferase [Proteobacteria bacterium]|nr:prolipoprotein diacylglyceryl transferase [Pseudomonadota bacterium]
MFAAIPFFQLGVYNLGPIPLDSWAILVIVGIIVGLEVARYRGLKLGMHPRDIVDAAACIVGSGFVMAHVVTVVAYHPERLQEDGIWAILRIWEGFSSFGGFLGAVLGAILFFKWIRPLPGLRYADVITYGFPFGWLFGRLGCASVHDHIGRETTFFLGMDFDHGFGPWPDGLRGVSGVRHELGLYEALFMLLVCALFWQLGKKDRPPGFFLGTFAVVYAPVRFGFDFLRNVDLQYADARYFSLTPAQWGAVAMFVAGAALLASLDHKGHKAWAMDFKPDQATRAEEAA